MKKIMQPGLRQLRDDNREVLKSLREILGDKSKVDLLVEKVDHSRDVLKDLHEILEDKSKLDQIAGQVEVLEAQISKIVEDVTWMGRVVNDESSTVIKIEKELADLKDLSARRHASVEVSTEGTQRSCVASSVTPTPSTLPFGTTGRTTRRSMSSTPLKASGAPIPPPPATAAPAQMGGASTVPPPPQHVPNLLNLTQPPAHPWHQGGPTAAVMLGNPQQIFRALAGHQDVNN